MMKLSPKLIPGWPKLAWVATFADGSSDIQVLHGPMVEVGNGWIAEAVWAGDFGAGDFDQTDLVFGSGVRCRKDTVLFVSSGSTLDRLWYTKCSSSWYVANSLPALLALTGLSLCENYSHYSEDMRTINGGLEKYRRRYPATGADLCMLYFQNLAYDGAALKETEKPDKAPRFDHFKVYQGFLARSMERLGLNLSDKGRKHPVDALVSVSRGYDSPAAAVLSRHAGCKRAVTFRTATSLLGRSDSGQSIAERLGLACLCFERTARHFPQEESVWAVTGRPGVLNWTLFDYPEPLCLFFTGSQGGSVWDRGRRVSQGDALFSGDSYWSQGACEYRLIKGFFQCPVPFMGIRHRKEIEAIGLSDEMQPWTLGNSYDRPIPRRIIEEAGIPRDMFAVHKNNTSHEAAFLWPFSSDARERFNRYLKELGLHAPSRLSVWLLRRIALTENLLHMNLLSKLGIRKRFRPWGNITGQSLIFQWANHELKKRYEAALAETAPAPSAASEVPTA